MQEQAEKTHEMLLRRMAFRRGLRLEKSRRRDPGAIDFNRWRLVDNYRGFTVYGERTEAAFAATLDEVERFLTELDQRRAA